MAHLQLSPGVELLQAVDRLLSVHHGGHRRPLLAEEKERLSWGLRHVTLNSILKFFQSCDWCLYPHDELASVQLKSSLKMKD